MGTMTEPVNLNKVRKTRARADGKVKAAQNRVSYGLAKVQKITAKLDAARAARILDGKARED